MLYFCQNKFGLYHKSYGATNYSFVEFSEIQRLVTYCVCGSLSSAGRVLKTSNQMFLQYGKINNRTVLNFKNCRYSRKRLRLNSAILFFLRFMVQGAGNIINANSCHNTIRDAKSQTFPPRIFPAGGGLVGTAVHRL